MKSQEYEKLQNRILEYEVLKQKNNHTEGSQYLHRLYSQQVYP